MNRREAIAALVSLPATATLTSCRVEPNDVIVIESKDHLSSEQISNIQRCVDHVWPNRKAVVLAGGLTLKIVKEEQG